METRNLPTLFDEAQLTSDEHAFLNYQDFRMRSVGMQFQSEIGRILKETRDWFKDNHKWGFAEYVQKKWGFDRNQTDYLIRTFDALMDSENFQNLGLSLSAQLELKEAPNQQAAVDEVKIRQELEEKITAKKAKEIADYQRDAQIARDNLRSELDRVAAIDRQLTYVKQQLAVAQQKANQPPKVVEKIVEKEVIPLTLKVQENGLRDQISRLQERERALTRERDSYRQQLHEERSVAQARMLEDLEGENAERVRVQFADAMRDYVNSVRIALNRLPSLTDTQMFEADDWQRLDEAIERTVHMTQELQKLKYRTSNNERAFVVDASVAR